MNTKKKTRKRVVVSRIEDMTPDQFKAFMAGDHLYTTDYIGGPGYFVDKVEYTSTVPGYKVNVSGKMYEADKYLFYE